MDATGTLITFLYLGIMGTAALGFGELFGKVEAEADDDVAPVFCLLIGDPAELLAVDPDANLPTKARTVPAAGRTSSPLSSVLGSPGLVDLFKLEDQRFR